MNGRLRLALAAAGIFVAAGNLAAAPQVDELKSVAPIYQAEEAALNRRSSDLRLAFAHYTPELRERLATAFERSRKEYGPDALFGISILGVSMEGDVLMVNWRVTGLAQTGAFPTEVTVDLQDRWRMEGGNWVAFAFRRLSPVQITRAHDAANAHRMRYTMQLNSVQNWSLGR